MGTVMGIFYFTNTDTETQRGKLAKNLIMG
jgi:hypothetical protein